MKKKRHFFFILATVLISLPATGISAFAADNLGMLSLDQLLDIEVVSVAKVPEKIKNTPAAIQVITQEDLRRSGANSIPEALRLVPGMHVYQIDANKWAISSRGFTSRFSNKMLVMIDGRTVYTPLFSGVFWDVQNPMMTDIDRIEVIRGPGGSLWGTNAVNGIINIITRDSADTQGGLVNLEGGNDNKNRAAVRYGGWLNGQTSYRIYGQYFNQDDFEPADFGTAHEMDDPNRAADDYDNAQAGFRLDRNQDQNNKITLQGDIYRGNSGTNSARPRLLPPGLFAHKEDEDVSGGNLLGRWQHVFSQEADLTLRAYYDHTQREQSYLDETRDTLDIDFQHHFSPGQHHELLWGVGYRYASDNIKTDDPCVGFYYYRFDPKSQSNNLFTGFIQDRYHFADNRGELTVGTKLEYNEYTRTEWQPSIRLLWKLNDRNSFWSAISRSVRVPSRLEHDGSLNTRPMKNTFAPLAPPIVPRLVSNDNLDAEKVISYELGCKSRPTDNLYLEITAFYNKYYDLAAGFTTGTPFLETGAIIPYIVVPMRVGNEFDAETFGVELSGNCSVTNWWRLSGSFSWFENNFLDKDGYSDPRSEFQEDNESNYQLSLISYMDLPKNLELNSMLFYVSELDYMNIDHYIRLDLNLSWHTTDSLTLTVGGRNLLDPQHTEYDGIAEGLASSEIPRTFYGKLSWEF